MLTVLLISLGVFVALALFYELKQNPDKFKVKTREKKQKEIKQPVDPDSVIDEKKVKIKKSKEKQVVADTFESTQEPEESAVQEIQNNFSSDGKFDDSDDDIYDDLFNDVSSDKFRRSRREFENDENYDYMFDNSDGIDDDLFSGEDAVDADDLETAKSNYSDLSKTLRHMPNVIKALMLSNILDKKDY